MSKILASDPNKKERPVVENVDPSLEITVKGAGGSKVAGCACVCKKNTVNVSETGQLGTIIEGLMNARKGAKTTIKLEIEFSE